MGDSKLKVNQEKIKPKKMSDFKITVYKKGNGEKFEIESGKAYQIINKFDANAPDGFQKNRTTKVPDPDASNFVNLAVWDEPKKSFDTALDKNSRRLNELFPDSDDLTRHLQVVTKEIYNPLISIYGADTLDTKNKEFWDNFMYNISVDNVLNTKDVLGRAQLYFLIIHGKLAPVGFESENLFKKCAQFSVENKETVVGATQKREIEKNKAIAKFVNLLDDDKEELATLLEYIGITGLDEADEALMNSVFTNWLDKDDNQNPKQFLEVYEKFHKSSAGKTYMKIYRALKELHRKKKIKKNMDGVIFEDEVLGKDFKEASTTVQNSSALLEKLAITLDE